MCGLTNASTRVVTARSYSRYSGSTSQDSDSVAFRIFLRDDLGDAALVRGIGIGVHQAHADGADVLLAEEFYRLPDARLVERPQLLALEVQPPADLAHETQRHDAVGLHPEVGIAVALGHRLAGDLQDVPEAFGDDQPERVDLALQQRVGRNRGAVGQADDVVGCSSDLIEDRAHAAHQADRRIGGRARDLGDARSRRRRYRPKRYR